MGCSPPSLLGLEGRAQPLPLNPLLASGGVASKQRSKTGSGPLLRFRGLASNRENGPVWLRAAARVRTPASGQARFAFDGFSRLPLALSGIARGNSPGQPGGPGGDWTRLKAAPGVWEGAAALIS